VYACETWSLTIRKEGRLREFVNRKTYGPKREEVTGGWRKLHNATASQIPCTLQQLLGC